MMNSLYNSIAGFKSSSFSIDVSANNIANINTTGFKYSNSSFKDVLAGTLVTNSINPSQAGHGSTNSITSMIFEQGSLDASEGEFDMALDGKGFFGVLGSDGEAYFTRSGSFARNENGYLIDVNGNFVLGTQNPALVQIGYSDRVSQLMGAYAANGSLESSGYTINGEDDFSLSTQIQTPILVTENLYLPAKTTQNINWKGNLDTSIQPSLISADLNANNFNLVKDEENEIYSINGKISKDEIFSARVGDEVRLIISDANGLQTSVTANLDEDLNYKIENLDLKDFDAQSLSINSARILTHQYPSQTLESELYNEDGGKNILKLNLQRISGESDENFEYKISAQVYDQEGNTLGETSEGTMSFNNFGAFLGSTLSSINNPGAGNVNLNFGSAYQNESDGSGFDGIFLSKDEQKKLIQTQDGLAEGFFEGYRISNDGSLLARFSNGEYAKVAKVALYNFINEQGLLSVGNNIFAQTSNSGEAKILTKDGQVYYSALFKGGFLERSNVDLSTQLTELITIQRSFDASSKSFTVSDEMIQKAINMKS